MRSLAALLLVVLLAGCGDLPRPFAGAPGSNGRTLLQPPPARLVVASPTGARLPEAAASSLMQSITALLVEREVPAMVGPSRPGVWELDIAAILRQGQIVPTYTVLDTTGRERGTAEGPPVDSATWQAGSTATLRAAALAATPRVAELLTRIEAERKRSDPTSLVNRPVRIFLQAITTAPGDGNTSLATQFRREMQKLDITVQDKPDAADFTVAATVSVTPVANKLERVEIVWTVTDAAGHERGRVVQLNEIPGGSLRGLWADIAVVVAQEAAPGVKDVMLK